ncbi:MAG: DPP IV N-terminal domain-containing protein [Proteiniphilum sp.]|nr:DPP IV N-terminal domain-containing protein [Proteiniphilum sp.]
MHKQSFFILFFIFSFMLSAQHEKQFSLEELIPGGKQYANFNPRIPVQFQWYGNRLATIGNDSVWLIDNPGRSQRKKIILTFKELEEGLEQSENKIHGLTFSPEGSSVLRFHTSRGSGLFDLENKEHRAFFSYPEKSKNHMLSPDHSYMAYTIENNLFIADKNGKEWAVSNECNRGIIYGQSVHRKEFGITGGIFWSPCGKKMAFYRMDETMVSDYPLVDASARVAEVKNSKYPMAGMTSHRVTIGIFDTETKETTWLKTGEPDDHYLTNIAWSPDGKALYLAELNRGQNRMKLNRYVTATGDLDKTLFEESHLKYVEPENPVLFVKKEDERFIWQSKRNGYNHLYLYDTSGKQLKQLTDGTWEVTGVIGFDEKGENLYFIATLPSPIDRHICSVTLRSGKITQHTTLPGMHSAALSASGRYLTDRYSSHDNPGRIDLIETRTGKTTLLSQAKNPFRGFSMPTVEMGTVKAADGTSDLYYRLVKPAGFDASKKYPVAVYVYGGPHSQMVSNRWRYGSGGWETHMAQNGYIVFVMDNRGTAYRGLEFENVTHRQLGVVEAEDQMKGVAFLQSLPYVDSERMGIHGWSYGGFMTINMLLRYPGVFKVGVAGGPVTDWKYYEVMYGERYMDTPAENPEGYEESSLLNKADRLQSRLLIIHGDEDPTVVMQNSIQFMKASIKAERHPDFFIYPGHGHNMLGRDRVHLHHHITRYFEDFIPQD